MADIVRREQFLGNTKNMVGDKYTDLVLETIGKVYIKTQNKSRLLNDLFTAIDNLDVNAGSNIIILENGQTINDIDYPGDGSLVYDPVLKILYLTVNGEYIELVDASGGEGYVLRTGDTMTGQLSIQLIDPFIPPLIVNSTQLVTNLNADYLDGHHAEDFAIKGNNETITGNWTFEGDNIYNGDNYYTGNLESADGFEEGMNGFGWQLNTETNTLTVDYLVVRKGAEIAGQLQELLEDKSIVKGIPGSVFVSQQVTVTDISEIEVDETSEVTFTTSQGVRNRYQFDLDENPLYSSSFDFTQNYGGIYNYWDYFQGGYANIEFNKAYFVVGDIIRFYSYDQEDDTLKDYTDFVITNIDPDTELISIRSSTINNNAYTKAGTRTIESFSSDIILEDDVEDPDPDEPDAPEPTGVFALPNIGDWVVKIGNVFDTTRMVALYSTWIEDDSPSMNLTDMANIPSFKENRTNNTINPLRARVGVLNNILDPILTPSGVGIYCDNLYAAGSFFTGVGSTGYYLNNGTISYLNNGVNSGLILNNSGQIDSINNTFELFTNNVKFPTRIQANWNETDIASPAYVANKPSFPLWGQTLNTASTAGVTGQLTGADGLLPSTSCSFDLGSDTLQYRDGYLCGTLTLDKLIVNTIEGDVSIIGTPSFGGNLIPSDTCTYDIGTPTLMYNNGYFCNQVTATTFNGNATSADKVNNTLTITGGSPSPIVYDGSIARSVTISNTSYWPFLICGYWDGSTINANWSSPISNVSVAVGPSTGDSNEDNYIQLTVTFTSVQGNFGLIARTLQLTPYLTSTDNVTSENYRAISYKINSLGSTQVVWRIYSYDTNNGANLRQQPFSFLLPNIIRATS